MAFTKTGNGTLDPLNIGISGIGTATIDGGTDVIRGYAKLGLLGSGIGTLTITGAGSSLTLASASADLTLGAYGAGTLNISSGGAMYAHFIRLGTQNGGEGTFSMAGMGTKVILSNDNDAAPNTYAGGVGIATVAGSTGLLSVTSGALLEIRNSNGELSPTLHVGSVGTGTAIIDGAGTQLIMTQTGSPNTHEGNGTFLGVGGRGGQGTLTISNEAQVTMTGEYGMFRVGRGNTDGDGGAPARLPLSEAFIQSGADVTLNMTGGNYYGAYVVIGARTNANGRLTIDGEGSTLTVHGDNAGTTDEKKAVVNLAGNGQGDLRLTNGGDILVDGGDDRNPTFFISRNDKSLGSATISGAGSTFILQTTNTSAGGGGHVVVGNYAGSTGTLTITDGGQLINDLNSTNSVMEVGRFNNYGVVPAASGTVTVDGNGNTATLLDAGQLLTVGATWHETSGITIADVDFFGGDGSVNVFDGATVRANIIAVGIGGTIGGNATFDGSVTVDAGGHVAPGASPGRLTVTGALTMQNGNFDMEVKGLTAGTQYDQVKVDGAVTLIETHFNIAALGTFNFAAGNRLLLIDGQNNLTVSNWAKVDATITGEPAGLAYLMSDEGGDFYFEALNGGSGKAIVAFGNTSQAAVTASINGGTGTGTGGRFDSAEYVKATGLSGTAAGDTLTINGSVGHTLLGQAGNDTLQGGGGKDTLNGGTGNDIVLGGVGIDKLTGGAGKDTLTGGGSKDTFFYLSLGDSAAGANRDVIADFSQAELDKINLAKIDASESAANNNAFALTGNGGADAFAIGVEGTIRFRTVSGNTIIQLEVDGDGVADAEIQLTGLHALTALDFIL